MKQILTFLLLLVFSAAYTNSVFAQTDGHVLKNGDAAQVVQILEAAGIKPTTESGETLLAAFDVFCIARNFQNTCFASLQELDPASSRRDIFEPAAGKLWSLLKKAGLKSFVNDVSDGNTGAVMINAGTARCTLTPQGDSSQCLFDAK